jgi:mannose-6-phosphate isomerase-like protein (cupin superfamily)
LEINKVGTDLAGISLKGEAKDRYMRRFQEQMECWGITMPAVEPLFLHFGLDDFDRTGLIEYWIANEIEAGYCGKFLFVFDGQTCPMHWHRNKVETFYILKGKINMRFQGRESQMSRGDTLLMNVDQPHSFTGLGPALLLEISKPCIVEDNYFENSAIPLGGNYKNKR